MMTVLTWIITVWLWILSMVLVGKWVLFDLDDDAQRPTWKQWLLNALCVAGFIYIIPLMILIRISDPFLCLIGRMIERYQIGRHLKRNSKHGKETTLH